MPEALAEALALPGLWWLVGAVFVAGLVRGFAGFGTGLIYLPVAAMVLPPVWAIITIILFDIAGPALIARRAVRDVHLPDLGRLFLGAMLGIPLGLWLLYSVAPEVFRYGLSLVALGLLVCLIAGLRYRGPLGPGLVTGTGGIAGLFGGAAGLPGPPVILLYMASTLPVAVVRGTTLLFLLGYDVLMLGVFGATGRLEAVPVWIGLMLSVPNALGNFLGARVFRPDWERVYRWVAYAIIAGSAIIGLPLWEN